MSKGKAIAALIIGGVTSLLLMSRRGTTPPPPPPPPPPIEDPIEDPTNYWRVVCYDDQGRRISRGCSAGRADAETWKRVQEQSGYSCQIEPC